MKQKSVRQVRVYGKYRRFSSHWNGGRDLPWVTMSGLWLEQAGFTIGDHLRISVENKKLIIVNHGNQRH